MGLKCGGNAAQVQERYDQKHFHSLQRIHKEMSGTSVRAVANEDRCLRTGEEYAMEGRSGVQIKAAWSEYSILPEWKLGLILTRKGWRACTYRVSDYLRGDWNPRAGFRDRFRQRQSFRLRRR